MPTDAAASIVIEAEVKKGRRIITARAADTILYADEINPAKADDRKKFIERLMRRAPGLPEDAAPLVEERLLACVSLLKPKAAPDAVAQPDRAALLAETPAAVRAEATERLSDPQLFKLVLDDIGRNGVAGERPVTASIYVCGTSRRLRKPISVIVQGPTASGKSHAIERTAEYFPPEEVIRATQMTPQALFHMPADALVHRFVVAGERSRVQDDESAEATRALREMLSSQRLSKLMPVREGNQIITRLIEQEGPIAFVESTTLTRLFEEDANRCILIQTDERAKQSRRILASQAAIYEGAGFVDASGLIELHHAIQRMLEPLAVVIPYARAVAELLPEGRVGVRRAFPHLMHTVMAVALLHQFQRPRDAGRVVAAPEDYQLAHHLLDQPMASALGAAVAPGAARFLERLRERFGVSEFTSKEAEKGDFGRSTVKGWLRELHDADHLDLVEEHKGAKPAVWRICTEGPSVGISLLPRPEVIFPDAAKTQEKQIEMVG